MRDPPDYHSLKSAGVIWVGEWRVDASTLCISKDEKTSKLEPLSMATLLYLARHPGETVTREELERELWHGQIVVYAALSNTIAKLRRAFEDDFHTPRYIETIPKVGYRLVAVVSDTPAQEFDDPADDVANKRTFDSKRNANQKLWWLIVVLLVALVVGASLTWIIFQRSSNDGATSQSGTGGPVIHPLSI